MVVVAELVALVVAVLVVGVVDGHIWKYPEQHLARRSAIGSVHTLSLHAQSAPSLLGSAKSTSCSHDPKHTSDSGVVPDVVAVVVVVAELVLVVVVVTEVVMVVVVVAEVVVVTEVVNVLVVEAEVVSVVVELAEVVSLVVELAEVVSLVVELNDVVSLEVELTDVV